MGTGIGVGEGVAFMGAVQLNNVLLRKIMKKIGDNLFMMNHIFLGLDFLLEYLHNPNIRFQRGTHCI